jgi:hypothetical protein
MKRGKAIWQLTNRTCRWPCGDPGEPDFYFCGAAPEPGFPYCLDHCCVAYLHFCRMVEVGGRVVAA